MAAACSSGVGKTSKRSMLTNAFEVNLTVDVWRGRSRARAIVVVVVVDSFAPPLLARGQDEEDECGDA